MGRTLGSWKLSESTRALLACPNCKRPLRCNDSSCLCTNEQCHAAYPVIDGVPILINEQRSVFQIKSYRSPQVPTAHSAQVRVLRAFQRVVPSMSHNWVAAGNMARLASLLNQKGSVTTVLIVGAGELGEGVKHLRLSTATTVIETDVCFGPNIKVIADGHDVPFLDQSIDAVVIQAVLEHVLDPVRCVEELVRVLKPDGLVYAETPFMYPVHLGPYDFTRFSLGGHRRLFRNFKEIDAGVVGGPGMALAASIRSFLYSLSNSRLMGAFGSLILPFFFFWLKYVDYFLIRKPHVADYAAGTYFLGAKGTSPICDTDIIHRYWRRNT